ncbi:ABC transporter permease [Microbacterium sp. EYE_5]|uniref:ABC transporter permease n=1 Tax=unclassified Microbacterium TaxID=2609290 RepID=UPI002002F29B|nr:MULTISPECIES: ABC transporter permease [unclassified Microbacterium]MCK6081563.1 ABC transporter permease [Microbacterium sp. EYE_382]MCK6086833.1 ABC transporter permease [Microbacterium sp. EYE_384]MCK6123669.1 ABC transporter permease [Microbacterium sp. EYE_80]MCK6126578.1 ABC transporter permease [Microbacterium sp. EYE_79]MCK6142517.1 ABC transporter permease [Microbacterium sp. EYE_39]
MSASAPALEADGTIQLTVVKERHFKVPIVFGVVVALMAVLFLTVPRGVITAFRLGDSTSSIAVPNVELPTGPTSWGLVVVLALLAGLAFWNGWNYRRTPLWLTTVFALLAVFAFIVWAAAGGVFPVTSLLFGAVSLSVPLVFGALGGVIGERVGVVNVAIEGQLLLGAFAAALLSSITGNPFVGLIGAMLGGVLVSFVLAAFAIKYLVDQVIVGVVLNVLVTGLTGFLYGALLVPNENELNRPERFGRIEIPLLSEIPVIGPVLFNQTFIVYLMYVTVAIVAWGLYRTRWGLRLRAVGEHPQAADTVGINVTSTRFWNVSLAGAIAGIGGAYFTLVSVPQFGKEMTAGLGFIALAAVIFGRWDPIRATLAALLFGFATNLQNQLTILNTPIPSEFMLMLPYVVTILAVAGFAGQIRGPAAAGKPYIKG